MASSKEILEFILKGNADDAVKAFQKTGAAAEKDLGSAEKKLDKLGGTLTKTGAGAVAFAGVAAAGIMKTVGAFNDLALEAGKMADATGLGVEQASKWIEVAGDIGVEVGTIQGSFMKLNKAVADGSPVLAQFGVDIAKSADGTTDVNQTFINAIDTIGKIPDATDRAAASQALFGRGYGEVAELIKTGADGVQTALAGVSDQKVIDEGELQKARDYRASMDALGDAAQDLMLAVGQGATPAIAGFAEAAAKAVGFVGALNEKTGGLTGQFLTLGVAGVGLVGTLSVVAGQVIKMRGRFVDAEGSLNNMGKAAVAASGALTGMAIGFAALAIIDKIRGQMKGTTAELQAFQAAAGSGALEDVIFKFQDLSLAVFDTKSTMGQFSDIAGNAFDQTKINAESMNDAFEQVLATSPAMAQTIIDGMLAVSNEVNAGNEKAKEFAEFWGLNAEVVFGWQKRVDDASAAQSALTNTTGDAVNMVNDLTEGVGGATSATDSLTAAQDRSKAMAVDMDLAWQKLFGTLDNDEQWLSVLNQFDSLQTAAEEAYIAAAEGSADAERKGRDHQQAVIDTKQAVAEYAKEVLGLPVEQVTEIIAQLDEGAVDHVENQLKILARNRTMNLSIQASGGAGYGDGGNKFHDGGVVPGPPGAEVPIIAKAGEIVVPTDHPMKVGLGGAGGGGPVFYVTINAGVGAPNGQELGATFVQEIKKYERINGAGWRN